jgi:predicted RNA-binding Zn ribbon-like protein
MVRMSNNGRTVKPPHAAYGFVWSDHHFINGNPALDLANTVVYRNRPERREDRLKCLESLDKWRRAAGLKSPRSESLGQILAVREAIDLFFRRAAGPAVPPDNSAWNDLVRLYAAQRFRAELVKTQLGLRLPHGNHRPHPSLLARVLHAAIELAFSPDFAKVKVCPGCGWLFIDRTRNGAKRWCITSLCGNRNKMRRYYRRKRRASLSAS